MQDSRRRKVSLRTYIITIILALIVVQLFGWGVWRETRKGKQHNFIGNCMLHIAKLPTAIASSFRPKEEKKKTDSTGFLVIHNPGLQQTNFVNYTSFHDSGYLLISAFDKDINQIQTKLFSIADNKAVLTWHTNIDALNKINNKAGNSAILYNNTFGTIHPLLTADSGLIVKAENSVLYKLDNHSKIVWSLQGAFHHSIEQDADGNYIIPYGMGDSKYKAYPMLKDEGIAKVSADGKLLGTVSVTDIMMQNGYEYFLFGVGMYEVTPLHINDVQPALTDGSNWQKGDLLISMRNRSSVMLYRPSTQKMIWLKTGPWMNQHDVNFGDNGCITVFGNDVIRKDKEYIPARKHNNLYVYNVLTQVVTTPYNTVFSKFGIFTERSGRGNFLGNGDVFVEETNKGSLLRINNDKIVWRYQEIVNDTTLARMHWSRYYTTLPWQTNKK